MEENKGCGCGCGCEEEMEAELLVFENEDGKEETFEVIGVFEVEEKEDTLIINKNEFIGVFPKYITDRKYKTFKNIVVVYI